MIFSRFGVRLMMVVISLAFSACWPNQRILESGRSNPTIDHANSNVPPAVRSFESDIKSMRTADFYNIYVFRRKDGNALDADDKRFLAANLPVEINRRMLSDEGKALIAGSNFKLTDEFLTKLKERFLFEDFSEPSIKSGANANT